MTIPAEFAGSPAFQFVQSRGWNWKPSTSPNIELDECLYCHKTGGGHFYMEIHGASDPQIKRDGLHACHRCGKGGNLFSLKDYLGVSITGIQSQAEWGDRKIEPLPDIEACHKALLEDVDALDYLINERGFSREIIEKQKLGLVEKHYFRETGNVKALVYPYLVNDNCIFVHYRTCPTMPISTNRVPKSFSSPAGWDVPLYNGQVLVDGLKEVIFVEGEANCIAAMDKGITNICGVPGANVKKAEWIDTLDKLESLEKIYICYDKDKVGQKAAQTLASRIGIEKCWKVSLPDFEVVTDEGEHRKGKDINEYFTNGGTPERFQSLLETSVLFDVDGVSHAKDAITEFEDELLKRGAAPKYSTPWPSLSKLIGFDDGDVIDIIAPAKIGKTTFALNILEFMADRYGDDGILICLEMTTTKLARKLISHVGQVSDNIPRTEEEAEALKDKFLKAIPYCRQKFSNRDGNVYLCYPKYKTIDDLYKLMIEVIRRYGVKWIVFDNLQRACDTTVGNKNRTQHLSEISKTTSRIAKDYGVQMLRILQPHQIKDGKLTSSNDNDGSSQVSKDCDGSIALSRVPVDELSAQDFEAMDFVESESSFSDKLLGKVDLSRYSAGGYTTLHFNGATSTISEYTAGEIARMQAEANQGIGYAAQLEQLTRKVEEEVSI